MGILSNIHLISRAFNNSSSRDSHRNDLEIEEDTNYDNLVQELEFDDETSDMGRSKEQHFEKVLQDPSQFETKEDKESTRRTLV